MENMELYEILGVTKTSTDAEIKQNYRKLAKEFHPDKNPDAGDKFKEISFAYEVLSNPEKRQVYDAYGLKGLQEGGEGGFSEGNDFFQQWFPFGGASHFGGAAGGSTSRRVAQVVVKLEVTLEEIYNGNTSKSFKFKRTEFCGDCEGRGGPKDALEKCVACNGLGKTASMSIMGMAAFESTCGNCFGRGNVIKDEKRCPTCSGAGLVQEEQSREVTIEKGAPNMLKIPFPSEGNQPLVGDRGDLVVVLIQSEHPTFVRHMNDLFLRDIRVSLTQALCGFVHTFQHLDGRQLCVQTTPGDVIKHGDMKMVAGEGMPLRNNPFERGNLFIEFRVEFPDNNFATPEQLAALEKILPPREPFEMPEEAEEVQMQELQPNEDFHGAAGGMDDDDDYEGGPQIGGVQCQTN